ncbi:hypothetical protein BJ165DRAFT_1407536 [Panaeolus papilionaceus]|nr:hypothetical protein BJ165DRAFT_1407536 [Panaeolus papilionaceus]
MLAAPAHAHSCTEACCEIEKEDCGSCRKRPGERKRKGYFEDAPMIMEDTSYFFAFCALGMGGQDTLYRPDNSFESIDISADSSGIAKSCPSSASSYSYKEVSLGECDTSDYADELLPFSLRSPIPDYTPSWIQEADAEWKQEVAQGMNAFRASSIDNGDETSSAIFSADDSVSDRLKGLDEQQLDDIHRWRHEFNSSDDDAVVSCSPDPEYMMTRHFHFP